MNQWRKAMNLIIKNSRLYDMISSSGELKDIVIKNYEIHKIIDSSKEDFIEMNDSYKIIDAKGRFVTPGFIECNSSIGLQGAIYPSENDKDEITDPINAKLRALDGINYEDESFLDALKTGITTIVSGPGTSNLIGGTSAILKTHGSNIDDMLVNNEGLIKFSLCQDPKLTYGIKSISPVTRLGSAFLVREALYKAKEYYENLDHDYDMELESLSRVFDGMLVSIEAREVQDIITSVRIAEEFNLNYVITGATEAYLIPEFIKEHSVKLIQGPVYSGKRTHELLRGEAVCGKILEDNDIKFSISTGHPKCDIKLFQLNAIMMYRRGMSWKAIMESLTINAANSIGLSNRIGSIAEGKDADIVIWSGDPLDLYTFADFVIINGSIAYCREDL